MVTTTLARQLRMVGGLLQKAGPYLLIEIILPGGTLIALILFLYRRGDFAAAIAFVEPVRTACERFAGRVKVVVLFLLPDAIASVMRAGAGNDGLEPLAMSPRT